LPPRFGPIHGHWSSSERIYSKQRWISATSCPGNIGNYVIEDSDAPPKADGSFECARVAHMDMYADGFRCTSEGSLILVKYVDDASRLTVIAGGEVDRVCGSRFPWNHDYLFDINSTQDEIVASGRIPNWSLPDSNPGDVFMGYTDFGVEETWGCWYLLNASQ
jgi:hypothetical protein